jgi:hypothetical protein
MRKPRRDEWFPQGGEESFRHRMIESQSRRQLHQNHGQLPA